VRYALNPKPSTHIATVANLVVSRCGTSSEPRMPTYPISPISATGTPTSFEYVEVWTISHPPPLRPHSGLIPA
jgi:hypothetical protein